MDPAAGVGGLAKIVEVVLKIKEAAETARQNKGDCDHVRSRVEMLCSVVQLLEGNAEAMNNDVVHLALKRAERVLDEALTLVTGCKEGEEAERNILCVLYDAGKLSRKLTKVDVRITSATTDVQTALQVYLASRPVSERRRLLPHSTPERGEKKNDRRTLKIKERLSLIDKGALLVDPIGFEEEARIGVALSEIIKLPLVDRNRGLSPHADAVLTGRTHTLRTVGLTNSEQLSQLPQEITKVAGEIKEATETIYVNKAYFIEIGRRVSSVGTLMSLLLENYTELVNQERMRAALGKLLDTLNEAHTLVKPYRGIRIIRAFLWPDRGLDRQLHRVLDLMLSDINAVNLIVMQN